MGGCHRRRWRALPAPPSMVGTTAPRLALAPLSFLFLPGLWQELRPTLILLVPAAPPCGSRSPDHSIILEFCWYQGIRPTEDGSIKIVLNKVFAIKKEKEEKKKNKKKQRGEGYLGRKTARPIGDWLCQKSVWTVPHLVGGGLVSSRG